MAVGGRGRREAVAIGLLVVLLVLVNYLAQRYPWRWDATAAGIHSLSEQTVKLLAGLPGDVRVLAFYDPDHPARVRVEGLLQEYGYRAPGLQWALVDPVRDAARARHYHINEQGTVVVERGDRQARLDGLADLGPTEAQLTNALIQVTRSQPRRVCVVEGHGERALADTSPRGLWALRRALEAEGYEVDRLTPLGPPVGRGCSVVVIADPTLEFSDAEQRLLQQYLAGGGRALILAGAGPSLALHRTLDRWGVRIGQAVIVDPLATVFGADALAPVITTYGSHESLKDFRLVTFFPWSRPVRPQEPPPPALRATPLIWSSPQSWARPWTAGMRPDEVTRNFVPATDEKGPLPLGVAVEAADTRLIVLGTSAMVGNQYLPLFGHRNLVLNLMAWLVTEPDLIALKPASPGSQAILLSAGQAKTIFYSLVVAYPLGLLAAGLFVWASRRRR
jgi:ABC-type uncharacterized transport system involved in gliding motility auxiliary subunit